MGRLVQIEVNNFKSYRNHHVIGPFKHFTAVIGPNGSGKSNLMDAISFVLGVQSSHLRSANLKELIYRGRSLTDPNSTVSESTVESAHSASVSAIYEDNDGRLITFTRTIAADGSSEYRIDNKVSKRDGYVAVLERENILVKARNFLVFQGDVEAVASQNPKDLTRLIEQVSGSLELKQQYDLLKVKLEKAVDLSSDMYQKKKVIQGELRSYKEQKEEANKWEMLEVERNQLLLDYTLWKLYHLEKDIAQIGVNDSSAQQTRTELLDLEALADRKISEGKQAVAHAVKQVIRCERQVRMKQNQMIDLKAPLAQFNQQSTHAMLKISQLEDQHARIDRDVVKAESGLAKLNTQIKQLDSARLTLQQSMHQSQTERLDLHQFHDEYERIKSKFIQATASLQQQIDSARISTKSTRDIRTNATSQRDTCLQKKNIIIEEKQVTIETLDRAKHAVTKIQHDLTELDNQIAHLTTAHGDIRAREQQLEEKLNRVNSQLMEYSHDQRASQRERNTTELMSELKSLFPGIHGRLSEVCRPSQKKYETAVAAVLGRHLDAIVTDSQATAMSCIRYMRENRKGHMQFLPLAELVVKDIPASLRMFPHARAALDVVTFNPDVSAAVKYACGSSLIADSLTVARHICYDLDTRVKCVTLDGITIQKGGGMTGSGGTGQSSGPSRWDTQEVNRLKEARDQLEMDLSAIKKERRVLAEKESPLSQRPAMQERLNHTSQIVIGLEAKLQAQETQLDAVNQQLNRAESTLQELDTEMTDVQVTELEEELAKVRKKVFASFCRKTKVDSAEAYDKIVVQSVVEEEQELRRLDAQRGLVDTRRQYESEQLAKIKQRSAHVEILLSKENNIVAEVNKKITDLKADMKSVQDELNSLMEQVESAKSVRDEKVKGLSKAKSEMSEIRKELERISKTIADHIDQKTQLHYARLQLLRTSRVQGIPFQLVSGSMASLAPEIQLAESQNVSLGIELDYSSLDEDLKKNGQEEIDHQLSERLEAIEKELERLSPNRRVMDKMSGVPSKAKQTEREFDSIRKSAKQAKDQFEKVRTERYSRFMEAFHHISSVIDKVYKDLTVSRHFPLGGTAYLSLESEDDPFCAGIKYHAMPPMKRFRDMEQLSGGEKTIAALALLFAINSFRPSPFFVLDEVDAALDNANVAKIARYVVSARSDTNDMGDSMDVIPSIPNVQFLVISLKNTFYEQAQALVGVHRDNALNTSSVLTLDLEQFRS